MAIKSPFPLLILHLLMITLEIEGILSKQHVVEFNEQHNLPKKSSIKSLKTTYGDIYDCVDFYKQPAFDHPSLQNHSFHPRMRPSFSRKRIQPTTTSSQHTMLFDSVKLEKGGCPIGTIPIKRVRKDDFIQMRSFTKNYALRTGRKAIEPQPGTYFAIVHTNSTASNVKYFGVEGKLNVYNLPIGPSQYSSGEMIIQNGDDTIKVGWTINPTINKDNEMHLFQYIDAGQSHCFNTLCPGFVSVNKHIPIDVQLVGASKRGGIQRGILLSVFQDAKSGHWWLKEEGKTIGFWPRQIFKTLETSATYIAVGGEAYSPLNQGFPPMGNGYYPIADMRLSAFCRDFTLLDAKRQRIDPKDIETYTNNNHYGVYDMGLTRSYGRLIYYGGTTLWT